MHLNFTSKEQYLFCYCSMVKQRLWKFWPQLWYFPFEIMSPKSLFILSTTFLVEKEKVYIFHIYFQIAMFLKTGVYNTFHIYFQIAMFLKTGVYNIYAYIQLISLESWTERQAIY